MKKIYLLFVAATLAACSAEPIQDELTSLDAAVTGKNKSTVQNAGESFDIPESFCAGEEATFTFNFPQNTNPQGKEQATHIFLQLLVEGDDPQTTEVEESYYYDVINTQYPGAGPVDVNYTFDQAGTYHLQYKIGSGGTTQFSVTVDNCGCTNELIADFSCEENGLLTLTFTAEEEGPIVIQGGLTNGTSITNATSDDVLTRNLDHPSVLNSESSVTRWEGYVGACQVVTITIEFTGGNGIGDWSAKRKIDDEEVTLGSTEEIECQ
ncbi:hypothetical protein [Salinimicrobium xinjiangense]|uniref:hypothetical protein n=1 Tax=Salinimicrobium xinjiangense TaxID=438596 RepID=UPI00042194B0|nr:hypothetical protein [Salinimicrobium xinjiangense]